MQFVTTVTIDVPDDLGSFQAIECDIQKSLREAGVDLLGKVLGQHEKNVAADKMLLIKDKRFRKIQSLAGEIQIERYRVFDRRQNRMCYPIDDWLGLKSRDPATPGLKNKIVATCAERSYRKANKEVSFWTGVNRNALSDWRLLQRESKELKKKQAPVKNWHMSALPSLKDLGVTTNPCPLLAIDLDGTYCKSKKNKLKNHDVKLAIIYTDKKPINKKKTRFALNNKTVVASKTNETLKQFLSHVIQTAITHYGLNNESFVVVHGDGDQWIKTFQTDFLEKSAYYLDPWHVFKKIRMATGLKTEIPEAWRDCVYGKPDELIKHLEDFKLGMAEQPDIDKINELIAYIENNRAGLAPHNIPDHIRKLSPGLFRKGSGQMESNICSVIADRFKQRRMSWTDYGLDNLATIRTNLLNNQIQSRYNVPDTKHRSKLWDGLLFGRGYPQ